MGACCSSAPKGGSYLDGTASITLDVGRVPSQPNDDTDNDVHSGIAALGPIVDDDAITHQVARMTQREAISALVVALVALQWQPQSLTCGRKAARLRQMQSK